MPKVLDEDQLRRKRELELKREARKAAKLLEKTIPQSQKTEEKRVEISGPSLLLKLPDVALQRILIHLPASDLGRVCATCRRIDNLLEISRVPYLLPRLQGLAGDVAQVSTAIERSYRGDTERLVVHKAKVPREFAGYARFIEQATSGFCRLSSQDDDGEILLPKFTQGRFVSVSPEHSVFRVSCLNGISTFGIGNRGQLGHNERVDLRVPKQIVGLGSKIVQVSAGGGLVRVAHTLLLTNTGRVLSFGTGQYGALGHGFSAAKQLPDVLRPTPIQGLRHVTVVNVSAGELHSACVTSDGDVYTWGDGFCGQLGHGDKRPQLKPTQIESGGLDDEIVLNVTCGARHTLAVTEDGQIFSWGLGHWGALGRSFTPFEYDADSAVGQLHVGMTGNGQDGPPLVERAADVQEEMPQAAPVSEVEAETAEEIAGPPIPEASVPFNDLNAELAAHLDLITNLTLDDSSDQCLPKLIDSLEGIHIVGASAGHRHSLVLSDAGRLYSFGSGNAGCLGHGDTVSQKFPIMVTSFLDDDVRIRQMSAGVDISMAVATNGSVYAWGSTKDGRIGIDNGLGNCVTIPRPVTLSDNNNNNTGEAVLAVSVECGYVHSLIVGLDGTVHICGGVGIEGQADGIPREGGSDEHNRGLPRPIPNMNLWHRLAAPRKEPVVQAKRWTKLGKYEVKGRSKMMTNSDG